MVGIEACGLEEGAVDGHPVGIAVVGTTVEMARLVLSVWLGTVVTVSDCHRNSPMRGKGGNR